MKKVFSLIIALIMVVSITACSNSGDNDNSKEPNVPNESNESNESTSDPIIVRYTTWGGTEDACNAVVKAFNTSRSDIQIKYESIPSPQLQPILKASLGTPDAPDIIWGSVSTELYALAGLIEPLDAYVERDNFDLSVFYPATLAQQYRHGTLYGLPKGVDTYAMVCNTAVFDKYGVEYPSNDWSWDDYDRISRELDAKIKAEGGNEFASALDITSSAHFFLPLIVSNGASFMNQDATECLVDDKAAVDMVDMVVSLINDGIQADFATLTENKPMDLYISGSVGMTNLPSYNKALSAVANSDIASTSVVLPWPKGPASGTNYVSNTTTNNYVMNSGSEVKDAAWEVLKFLTSEEADKIMSEMKAHTPARISSAKAWSDSFENLDTSVYIGQLESLVTTNFPDNYLPCLMNITPNLVPMYNGEITPTEALDNMAAAINELLSENE